MRLATLLTVGLLGIGNATVLSADALAGEIAAAYGISNGDVPAVTRAVARLELDKQPADTRVTQEALVLGLIRDAAAGAAYAEADVRLAAMLMQKHSVDPTEATPWGRIIDACVTVSDPAYLHALITAVLETMPSSEPCEKWRDAGMLVHAALSGTIDVEVLKPYEACIAVHAPRMLLAARMESEPAVELYSAIAEHATEDKRRAAYSLPWLTTRQNEELTTLITEPLPAKLKVTHASLDAALSAVSSGAGMIRDKAVLGALMKLGTAVDGSSVAQMLAARSDVAAAKAIASKSPDAMGHAVYAMVRAGVWKNVLQLLAMSQAELLTLDTTIKVDGKAVNIGHLIANALVEPVRSNAGAGGYVHDAMDRFRLLVDASNGKEPTSHSIRTLLCVAGMFDVDLKDIDDPSRMARVMLAMAGVCAAEGRAGDSLQAGMYDDLKAKAGALLSATEAIVVEPFAQTGPPVNAPAADGATRVPTSELYGSGSHTSASERVELLTSHEERRVTSNGTVVIHGSTPPLNAVVGDVAGKIDGQTDGDNPPAPSDSSDADEPIAPPGAGTVIDETVTPKQPLGPTPVDKYRGTLDRPVLPEVQALFDRHIVV